jgi:transposase
MSHTELLIEPQRKPVRQLKVAAGTGQRRTWTREQKARIVAESNASTESVTAVARRHGITAQQLYRWRCHDRHQVDGTRCKDVTFAPVIVTAPVGEDQSRRNARTPMIEVDIGAMTVRVSAGCDPATLQMVLRAVRAAS